MALVSRKFASTLLDLFSPYTDAQFQSAVRLPFRVSMPRFTAFECRVKIRTGGCKRNLRLCARLTSSVWVDPATARVLRIEMQATNMPSSFPMDAVESAVDYSYVTIGELSSASVHAELGL